MINYYKLLPTSYNNKTFNCVKEIKNATKDKTISELEIENKDKWKKRMKHVLSENDGYFIDVSLYITETVILNSVEYELTNYIIYKYPKGTDNYGSDVDIETINLKAFYEIVKEIMEEEQKSYSITKVPHHKEIDTYVINVSVLNESSVINRQHETTIIEAIHNVIKSIGFYYRR